MDDFLLKACGGLGGALGFAVLFDIVIERAYTLPSDMSPADTLPGLIGTPFVLLAGLVLGCLAMSWLTVHYKRYAYLLAVSIVSVFTIYCSMTLF